MDPLSLFAPVRCGRGRLMLENGLWRVLQPWLISGLSSYCSCLPPWCSWPCIPFGRLVEKRTRLTASRCVKYANARAERWLCQGGKFVEFILDHRVNTYGVPAQVARNPCLEPILYSCIKLSKESLYSVRVGRLEREMRMERLLKDGNAWALGVCGCWVFAIAVSFSA